MDIYKEQNLPSKNLTKFQWNKWLEIKVEFWFLGKGKFMTVSMESQGNLVGGVFLSWPTAPK